MEKGDKMQMNFNKNMLASSIRYLIQNTDA